MYIFDYKEKESEHNMNDINQTLLDALFTNVHTLERRKNIYFNLKDYIFPNSKDFIKFLQTKEVNEKRQIAKNLLELLCFESNYSPDFSLLTNLNNFETSNFNKVTKNQYLPFERAVYIPQDHFIHILNLYILGVYIYFYHPTFNRDLIKYFSNKRSIKRIEVAIDATKDFISCWKYFCLYHDLTYPIEALYNGKKISDDEYDYVKNFNFLNSNILKSITIKAATKLIVIWQLIDDKRNFLFTEFFKNENVMYSNMDNKDDDFDIKKVYKEYKDYICVDKITCFENIKMLSGFIDDKDVISVLFNAYYDLPIAFKINKCNSIKNNYDIYVLKNYQLDLDDDEIRTYLHDDSRLFNKKYKIRYCIKNLKKSFLQEFDSERVNEDTLNAIVKFIKYQKKKYCTSETIYFYNIQNRLELNIYIKQLNDILLQFYNEIIDEIISLEHKISENDRGIIKSIISQFLYNKFINDYLIKDLTRNISKNIYDLGGKDFSKSLLDKNNIEIDNLEKSINTFLCKIFSQKNRKKIINDVSSTTANYIDNQIMIFFDQMSRLADFFFEIIINIYHSDNYKDIRILDQDSFYSDNVINLCKKNVNFNELNNKMCLDMHVSYEDLCNKYKTDYTLCDHGICSSEIYLLISNFYNRVFNNLMEESKNNKFIKVIIPLIWNININVCEKKLVNDYRHIISNTAFAIACHNIYPDRIKKCCSVDGWRTNVEDNPFSYFCMLNDNLQRWGREKFFDKSKINYLPYYSLDKYNITIRNDKIIISILNYIFDYNHLKEETIDSLNDYLTDVDEYLELEIMKD